MEDFNPLDYKEAYLMLMTNLQPDTDREIHEQEFFNWFNVDPNSEEFEARKNRLLKLLSNMPGGGAGYESAEEHWAEKTEQGRRIGMEKADGGIIQGYQAGGFPRRTGAISGPGTGTSDSVPAMLSDGEFVMTADAVRNAGGGDRRVGAQKMYNLMNRLEGGMV